MSGNRKIKINRRLGNPITGLSLSLDSSNVNSYLGSGTNWLDLTTNANNVTFVNEPVFSNANSGVLVFDGSNWGTIADNSSLEFGNGMFTMETWVKFSELRGYQGIISKPGYSDGNGFLFLLESNNKFTMYAGNGAWQVGLGGQVTPNVDEWYHVVITRNVNGEWKMWINGQDQSGNPGVNTSLEFPDNETNMYIGSYTNFPGYSNQPANNLYGSIGLVKVWKGYCMSPSIVEANYGIGSIRFSNVTTTTTTAPLGVLLLSYDMGDINSYPGSGTTVYDLSGNNNDGVLSGDYTYDTINGGVIDLGGNNAMIEIPNNGNITPPKITLEAWVRPDSISDYHEIIRLEMGTPVYVLRLETPNNIRVGYTTVGYGYSDVTININDTLLDKWCHIVTTYESGSRKVYLNGQLVNEFSSQQGDLVNSNNTCYISSYVGSSGFVDGKIGLFNMYNYALTSTEVSNRYNSTKNRFKDGSIVIDGVNTSTLLMNGAQYDIATDVYTFDGDNDYAETNYVIPEGDFSFGGWAKSSTSGSWSNRLMGNADSTGGYDGVDIIWQSAGEGILWVVRRSGANGGGGDITSGVIPNLSIGWHYVVVTYNTVSGLVLYVDGEEVSSNGTTGFGSSLPFRIGRDGNGTDAFNGQVSGVFIDTVTLTATDVLNNFNSSKDNYVYTFILPFEAGFNDMSLNRLSATTYNNPVISSDSKIGTGSLYKANKEDGLIFSSNNLFNFGSGDFTFETWVKFTSSDSQQAIFTNFDSWAVGAGCIFFGKHDVVGGRVCLISSNLGVPLLEESSASPENEWVHYAIVRIGNDFTLYKNGVSVSTANASGDINTSNNTLYVGYAGDNPTGYGLIGYLDSFRINKGTALYTSNFTPEGMTTTTTTTVAQGDILVLNFESDFSDSGPNALTVTENGSPSISTNSLVSGGSYYSSGDMIYLNTPVSPLFDFGSSDFTIETWVNMESGDSSQCFLSNYSSWPESTGNLYLGVHPSTSGRFSFWIRDLSNDNLIVLQDSVTPELNRWYHLAAVRNGGTVSLYKDGILVASDTLTGPVTNSNKQIFVGCAGDDPVNYGFKGYLDSLKIANYAKYTANFEMSYWTSKLSGFGASLNNGAAYDSGTDIYTVDGVNDYALLTNAPKPTSEMTLMAWVKADQLGGWRKAVIFPYGANSWQAPYSSYQIATDGTQFVVAFQVDTNFSTGSVYTSGATTNTWYHVAGTFKNGVIKMYINGQLVNTKDVSSTGTNIIYTNHSNMLIGLDATYFQQEQWDGQVSNIEIHSVELSGSAILNKYNSTSAAHSNTTTTTTTAAPTTTTTTTSSGSVNLIMNLDAGNISSYPGTGTNWYDLTNTYSGISLVNGATFDSNSGGSIVLDGVNDYVSLGNIAVTPSKNKFTFNAVYKFDKSKGGNAIFSTGTSGSSTQDILFAHDGNVFFFQINNNADGGPVANYSYTSNTWLNVCVVYDATQANNTDKIKVYFNGVQNTLSFGSFNVPSTTTSNNSPSYLGKYISYTGWDLKGSIAIAQLYDGALTSGEVAANFDAIKDRFGLGTTTTTTTTAAPTTTTTTTAAPTTTTTTTVAGGSLFSDARGLYSLRLVNPSYSGSAIRVRRSSDNVEQNIGFSSGELDTTSLTSFVGSNTGYVVTWFDQSGNSFDITQSNTTKQPRIINNGTMYTLGSKPSVYFDNTTNTNVLSTSLISGLYNTSLTSFSVASKSTGGNGRTTYSRILSFSKSGMNDYDNVNGLLLYLGQSTAYTFAANSNISAPFSMDTKTLFVSTRISGNLGIAVNGGSLQTLSTGMANMNSEYFRIGNDVNESDSGLIGHVQEVILYNSDKTSIISNVKSNINTYYGIY